MGKTGLHVAFDITAFTILFTLYNVIKSVPIYM